MNALTKPGYAVISFPSFCKTFGYSGAHQFSTWQKENPGLQWRPGDDYWDAVPMLNGNICTEIARNGDMYVLTFKDGITISLRLTDGDNTNVQPWVTSAVDGLLPQ